MDEGLKELVNKYKKELEESNDFNPCTSCCDLASAQEKEYLLERFVKDLESISQ